VVKGDVFRFLAVGGRVVAIRYGRPANVKGDGKHTISELIGLRNAQRFENQTLRPALYLANQELEILTHQGLQPGSVPALDQIVWLARTSNLRQGAESVDATESVHHSYIELVEHAMRHIGLKIGGADVAIEDAHTAATHENYHFIELNNSPGFAGHQRPLEGKPRDIAGHIVDYLATL
jgi:glutamate--cysteine ligase